MGMRVAHKNKPANLFVAGLAFALATAILAARFGGGYPPDGGFQKDLGLADLLPRIVGIPGSQILFFLILVVIQQRKTHAPVIVSHRLWCPLIIFVVVTTTTAAAVTLVQKSGLDAITAFAAFFGIGIGCHDDVVDFVVVHTPNRISFPTTYNRCTSN